MVASQEDVARLCEASWEVGTRTQQAHRLDNRELSDAFAEAGFFHAMGYGPPEHDVRVDLHSAPAQTDIVLRSFTGRPIALLAFQSSDTDPSDHYIELEAHARALLGRLPGVAALTTGHDLWLFQVEDGYLQQPPQVFHLAGLTRDEASTLKSHFKECRIDWRRQLRYPDL